MLATPACVFFDKSAVPDFRTLVTAYGKLALASPFRSTVPLLGLVKDQLALLDRMLSQCAPTASGARLHMEFRVKSPKGRGKASHTDAMALTESCAVAVETKWTEPRGAAVGDFQKLSTNKQKVLEGWLQLLGRHATSPLGAGDFSDAIYQVLHRAASACHSERTPCVVYLHFHRTAEKPQHPTYYFNDLTTLYDLLGRPSGCPFWLVELPLEPTGAFKRIEGLKKGTDETDAKVRAALIDSRLFDFGEPVIRSIGQVA
jgi:hypothetical protein